LNNKELALANLKKALEEVASLMEFERFDESDADLGVSHEVFPYNELKLSFGLSSKFNKSFSVRVSLTSSN